VVRCCGIKRHAAEVVGMPVFDPQRKFISLTWRLGSGPTNQTKALSQLVAEETSN
jgi:hypothetical protein